MPLYSQPSAQRLFLTRADTLQLLEKQPWCDVLVIGGGIHGATAAHVAACNGFKTVLLERSDYASGASSRSSKLAHGGIRYLEQLDFRQVFEGLRAREQLFRSAPHLVRAQEFAAPILKAERGYALKLWAGLALYSAMALGRSPLPKRLPTPKGCSGDWSGALSYRDGVMSDTRLVFERILAARQEGAHCLNYARSELFLPDSRGVEVRWRDVRPGANDRLRNLRAGVVLNCAGPWIAEAGGMTTRTLAKELRYSRGTHIIFSKIWDGPALLLPIREGNRCVPGRFYFVVPHAEGTLVGTTEREIAEASSDALPSADELEEIFDRLTQDLPESGLTRETAHYCFAGVRALPADPAAGASSTSGLTRRHRWIQSQGVWSLVGGKYTTALWTSEEGVRRAARHFQRGERFLSIRSRLLPGAASFEERRREFLSAAKAASVPGALVSRALQRFGGRAVKLLEVEGGLEPLGNAVMRGEIILAREQEQAETLEDVFRRRLELECQQGHGLEAAASIAKLLEFGHEQVVELEQRMTSIANLLRPSS